MVFFLTQTALLELMTPDYKIKIINFNQDNYAKSLQK